MKKFFAYSLILTSLLFTFANATPPENLTCAKRAVIEYYNSGQYEKDVDFVVQDAEKYLFKRVNENKKIPQRKLAMILDIDETSLSNFLGNKKYDFSGLPQVIDLQYREENTIAIKPVLRLFNEAIKNGVIVFFITFRPDEVRSHTISALEKAGYHGWKNIYLPKGDELKLGAETYKTDIRKMLTQEGYDIILNLGDQETDLAGGFSEHTSKIPNPLYTLSPKCETSSCS
jgi:predicted secreted acid phosphatase